MTQVAAVLDIQRNIIFQLHELFYAVISCDMTEEGENSSPWQQEVI